MRCTHFSSLLFFQIQYLFGGFKNFVCQYKFIMHAYEYCAQLWGVGEKMKIIIGTLASVGPNSPHQKFHHSVWMNMFANAEIWDKEFGMSMVKAVLTLEGRVEHMLIMDSQMLDAQLFKLWYTVMQKLLFVIWIDGTSKHAVQCKKGGVCQKCLSRKTPHSRSVLSL